MNTTRWTHAELEAVARDERAWIHKLLREAIAREFDSLQRDAAHRDGLEGHGYRLALQEAREAIDEALS